MNIKELEKRIERLENKLELATPDVQWTEIGELEWSEDLGEMNWEEAMAKAKSIGARVPTRIELIDLIDNHYEECQKLIEDSPSNYCWSATEYGSTVAWSVFLSNGTTSTSSKSTGSSQVRCVR